MDFNQVRYFLAVANTLNFTRAAEQCYVSQSALTQAIKRLEMELGGELVHRNGRYTELTELGKSLRSHFEQIERTRHMVKTTAKAVLKNEMSELNIGIMCTVGPRIIGRFLDAFQMSHPRVSLILHDVIPDSIPDLLLSGVLDGVFFARHNEPHPQLHHIELFKEDMVITFASGHKFSDMDEIPLDEIASQYYVERLYCEFREEFKKTFLEKGLEIKVVFRCQREDWIQSLVRDGMGVCLIPKYSLLQPELDHRLTSPSISRIVEFVTVEQQTPSPVLNQLIALVRSFNWPTN